MNKIVHTSDLEGNRCIGKTCSMCFNAVKKTCNATSLDPGCKSEVRGWRTMERFREFCIVWYESMKFDWAYFSS